jgi:branched-subunit amino acid transport protein
MNLWLIVIAMGIVTFGIRLVPIVLLGRIEIPLVVQRALRFVPPAVLTAIIVPELLYRNDQIDVSVTNVRLLAGLIAIVVAWRTKNALLTIGSGMIALWVMQAIVGALMS